MFDRILIANRGEIARRIARTARSMGVGVVAVYSDADAVSAHVMEADAAVRLGPAPATESYLRGARVIEAALATGAQAIHPGYGFLSENPAFAEAVEAAGLVFVGPPASAIRAMGLKDAAKALMAEAGVPVVPGYHGETQDDAHLADQAALIGYPVLIKAVAGGGGKGMRRVDHPRDFAEALGAARREAARAFGDGRVLIERYVTAPRHIEVQVFGDRFGDVVHLFERDCSMQRRHQKVIEEAPAPGMTPETRAAMGVAAVRAAQAVGYVGAGTVEFIVDGARAPHPDGFWFMEMNTRLQVEHPVTEAIAGVDLVEWQLRIAAGEPLPLRQEAFRIDGHAMEARVYAETPARGFLPATGFLSCARFPQGVRVDAGPAPGDAITTHYDPMIAKIVAHGPTREIARRRLARALERTRISGCATNLGFLARLVAHPDFAAERLDTGLIERDLKLLTDPHAPDGAVKAVAALLAAGLADDEDPMTGFALWAPLRRAIALEFGGERHDVVLSARGGRRFEIDGVEIGVEGRDAAGDLSVRVGGLRRRFGAECAGAIVTVFDGAEAFEFRLPDPTCAGSDAGAGEDSVTAPMPGIVLRLSAIMGEDVAAGAPLVVIEAMKMEHVLRAPRDGRIASVDVEEGAQVEEGAVLLTLQSGEAHGDG